MIKKKVQPNPRRAGRTGFRNDMTGWAYCIHACISNDLAQLAHESGIIGEAKEITKMKKKKKGNKMICINELDHAHAAAMQWYTGWIRGFFPFFSFHAHCWFRHKLPVKLITGRWYNRDVYAHAYEERIILSKIRGLLFELFSRTRKDRLDDDFGRGGRVQPRSI